MKKNKKILGIKSLLVVLVCVLIFGGAIGGTIAWLSDTSEPVVNTFTESDIDITLTETKPANKSAKMVPGWEIEKDPTVTVTDGSEDCWLFVEITESTSPSLDSYIAYEIANGWETVKAENNGVTVIGRRVYKTDSTKTFGILGAGEYIDSMGTPNVTDDDYTISWGANEVCVKPSVTEDMMEAIGGTQKPTLSFKAYAVQLYKDATTEFTRAEAWARAEVLG